MIQDEGGTRAGSGTATGVGTSAPSALATIISCSRTWAFWEPGAGLALGGRPT